MKNTFKHTKLSIWFASFSLVFQLCASIPADTNVKAQSTQNIIPVTTTVLDKGIINSRDKFSGKRVSPDLDHLLQNDRASADRVRVIIQTEAMRNGELPATT